MKKTTNPNCNWLALAKTMVFLIFAAELPGQLIAGGTWTALNNAPPLGVNNCLLLSDGSVLGMNEFGQCVKLTPDIHGSYVNGVWTVLSPMNYSRLYFSSDVLTNGNVYASGGEYGGGPAELYNTVLNTWTIIQLPTENYSDADSMLLPNGNVLQSDSQSSYFIYDTAQNTESLGGSCEDMNETCWVRLPNDNVLSVTGYSITSEHYVPSLGAWYIDNDLPVSVFSGDELGAAFVLPNNTVLQIGATTNTAVYTPGTSLTSAGSWVAGPGMQVTAGTNVIGLGAADAPAAMMVNGNILCCLGAVTSNGVAASGDRCYFLEYNSVTNGFTQVGAPGGGSTYNTVPYYTSMLCLPDGTLLFVGGLNSTSLYVFTPNETSLAAGRPTINSISENADGSYMLKGVGLAGLSGGAAFGDDEQMNTSYPLVRMTNTLTGNVYYARTYTWSSTTIQNPNPVTTDFALPQGLPPGTYSLVVTVMGNVSSPYSFTYAPPSVPTGLTALGNDGQVALSWNAVSGATSYNVKQLVPGNPGNYETVATLAGTNYTVTNLDDFNAYSFVVSAIGSNGSGSNSMPVAVTLAGPPATPTGVSAYSDTFGRITLAWTPAPGPINFYNISRSTAHNGPYTNLADSINPFYTDSGLALGQTYYYVVSAVSPYGESSNSTETSAASQNIANFGFEQPPYAQGAYNYDPTNGAWQFSGVSPGGSGMLANGSAFHNANAPEGLKAAFLQGTGVISQTLSGFVPGKSYSLSYSAAQRPENSQTWNVMIDNTVIQTNNTPGDDSYVNYSANFTATAEVHTLSFVGTDLAGGDNTVFLDDIAIWPVQPGYGGNFGFESPGIGIGNYQYSPSGATWTFSGSPGNGSGIVANGSGFGNPNAPQGVQAAFVQGDGTISQTLTNLSPGTLYSVSYLAAQRSSVNVGGETWNVAINNIIAQSNNVPGSAGYTQYSTTFTATSSSETLMFAGTDLFGGDNTVFIDNVVIGVPLQPLASPAITLLGVTNEELLNFSSAITLSANVAANGNNVSAVQYFYDTTNVLSGQLTSSPYSYSWDPSLTGNHYVFARVYYNNGSHQDSSAAAINFFSVLPATATDVVGSQVNLQAVYNVLAPLFYQWQKISGGVTNNITGATNSTVTLTNLQLSDSASYQLVASNTFGAAVRSLCSLTVNSVPSPVNGVTICYAAQTGLGGSNNNFYTTWTLARGSLIQGFAPSSVGSGDFSEPIFNQCGTPAVLTDGSVGYFQNISGDGDSPTEVAAGSGGAGQSVTYTLTTVPNGYNLTNITVYGGWGDGGRDQQTYTISYATATAPTTFITLGAANYLPPDPLGVNSATRATFTAVSAYLATNVVALKFDFTTPAGENGFEGYSEIQVFGVQNLPPVAPIIQPPHVSGGNLIIIGTNGTPNNSYTWLFTTNLTPPIIWTTNSTGKLDGAGAFSNSVPINSLQRGGFFRLRTP